MNVSSAAIRACGLVKTHGQGQSRVRAVDEVDLEVPQGQMLAVMGPSGCGKSTLLHLLGGLERPTDGEVWVAGRRIDTMSERALARMRRRSVGFVFQAFHLVEELSATENVELPALLAGRSRRQAGRSRRQARRRAGLLLERVGLAARARHLPSQLSGVGSVSGSPSLARWSTTRWSSWPTSRPATSTPRRPLDVLRIFQELRAAGQTFVIVTHDERVAATADRLVSMRDGMFVDDTRLDGSHTGGPRRADRAGGLNVMGSIVLVVRLVLADVRRHKVQAVMLLLAVTVATATLALGLSLRGVSDALYEQTRAATAGPDVVALSGDTGPAVTSALTSLANEPEVIAHHGPYRIVYADLTTRDSTASPVVVHGFAERPGTVNRPLVTSGQWVRSGGTVLERGFATALGVGVGDRVTIAGRSYPVVGIAVTAATSIYPVGGADRPGRRPQRLQRPGLDDPIRCPDTGVVPRSPGDLGHGPQAARPRGHANALPSIQSGCCTIG
ncbi:hypothetical protein GCM10020219_034930 [Nonomuraea dietziae]